MKFCADVTYTVADSYSARVVIEARSQNEADDKISAWAADGKHRGMPPIWQETEAVEVSELVIDFTPADGLNQAEAWEIIEGGSGA